MHRSVLTRRLAAAPLLTLVLLAVNGPASQPVLGVSPNTCTPAISGPDDPDYAPAERGQGGTWNEEAWYLYDCMPQSAPLASDPEGASGMSVNRAWQAHGMGSDDVLVAYMEGGVNWRIGQSRELRLRAHLNTGELPYPQDASGQDHGTYDLNGDGVVDVDDYAQDPRIHRPLLHADTAGGITSEDLIVAFGHCKITDHRIDPQVGCPAGGRFDNDGDGYANDISGWNFHRDDNDPQTDQSIYAHANDESAQAVGEAGNAFAGAGLCPRCRLLSVKMGDEAIDRPDRVAEGIAFAVDSGARVIIGVEAGLGLTPELRAAFDYAYRNDVVVAWASNDFDSADHTEGMFYPHVWPGNSITGDRSTRGTRSPSVLADRNFRSRSSLTSFGPQALFSVPNNDGSTSTGTPTQGGVAALVVSAGLDAFRRGRSEAPLTADEVKQVVRSTVSPIDDPTLNPPGLPGASFNIQYGYGRPNVARAVDAVFAGRIPPTASLTAPDWYQEIDPTLQPALRLSAEVAARRAPGPYHYLFQYGLGPQPLESQFVTVRSGSASHPEQVQADLDLRTIPASFWSGAYALSSDRLSIERYDVTVRVQVRDSRGLMGEDRRVFHLRHDETAAPGFPIRVGSSGESSPTLADLEGTGRLDVVLATADGTVHAYRPGGGEVPGFPVHTGPAPGMDPSPSNPVNYLAARAWKVLPHPRDGIAAPTAVADLLGDGRLEIVATTMSGVSYVWDAHGVLMPGFPVMTDRSYRWQPVPVPDTPYERGASTGALAAPVLAPLERGSRSLDIIQAAWDGHVYAWRPDGTPVPGWPVLVENPSRPPGQTYAHDHKLVSTPVVADIDGEGQIDLVVAMQDTSWPSSGAPVTGYLMAYHGDGNRHPGGPLRAGWPVTLTAVEQGYGTAQDFVTEGITSPAVYDTQAGPVAVANMNLSFPNAIDLRTRRVRPLPMSSIAPGGPLVQFTTGPALGSLAGGPLPQMVQAGSAAADIVSGITQTPGAGIQVHNGVGAWDPSAGTGLPQLSRPIQGLGFFTQAAIADVTGTGLPDLIQAADSGALMAFDGRTGQDATGFPKWTGGWGLFSPAVGDVFGDGHNAVVQQTREGYLYLWPTPGLAASNEAFHWHQDNLNSGHWHFAAPPGAGGQGSRPA